MLLALSALAACASAPAPQAASQPALAQLAQPYAAALATAGVADLDSGGRGAMVRAYTAYGTVYLGYPEGIASARFALHVDGAGGVSARSDDFDAARAADYAQALQAIVPAMLGAVRRNNRVMYERANPER